MTKIINPGNVKIEYIKELDKVVHEFDSSFDRAFDPSNGTIESAWGDPIPNNWELLQAAKSAYWSLSHFTDSVINEITDEEGFDYCQLSRASGLGKYIEPWLMNGILSNGVIDRMMNAHRNISDPNFPTTWYASKYMGSSAACFAEEIALIPSLKLAWGGSEESFEARAKAEESLWQTINSNFSTYGEIIGAVSLVNNIRAIKEGITNARKHIQMNRAIINTYEKIGMEEMNMDYLNENKPN